MINQTRINSAFPSLHNSSGHQPGRSHLLPWQWLSCAHLQLTSVSSCRRLHAWTTHLSDPSILFGRPIVELHSWLVMNYFIRSKFWLGGFYWLQFQAPGLRIQILQFVFPTISKLCQLQNHTLKCISIICVWLVHTAASFLYANLLNGPWLNRGRPPALFFPVLSAF